MPEKTIFDKIVAREVPADIVYENDDVLAFHDIEPQAPVHVLVIPKKRIDSFTQLGQETNERIGPFIRGIAATADSLNLEENGYRVVFNTGRDALQTVPYIHAHILGGRSLQWPPG